MDPRDHADTLLARAQARSGQVVTPDNMVSPMDASNTQQIPGSLVSGIDGDPDPDSTTVLPSERIEAHVHHLAEPNPTTPLGAAREQGETARAQDGAAERPEQQEQRFDGLIPTTTSQTGKSKLQSRLEGF